MKEEVNTLSDHKYIRMDFSTSISSPPISCPAKTNTPKQPRWTIKRLDKDALMAAANVIAWPEHLAGPDGDVNEEAAPLWPGCATA